MIYFNPPAKPSPLSRSAGTGESSSLIFLIGWAIGGICFGVVADRIGRTKTLIITILIYAIFTGLAALSQDWWHLAIYRFLTALGIGGEWAAGAALVAETWPEEKRAKAAGILQSAWAVGFFLAASFNLLLKGYGWRGDVCDRRTPGLCVVAGPLACEGTGPLGEGSRPECGDQPRS